MIVVMQLMMMILVMVNDGGRPSQLRLLLACGALDARRSYRASDRSVID